MTERVKSLLTLLKSKEYKKNRISEPVDVLDASMKHNTEVFCASLDIEKPNLFPGDRIGFNRYNSESPMTSGGNFAPSYNIYLQGGFEAVRNELDAGEQNEFTKAALEAISALYRLCDRYRDAADGDLKAALSRVPRHAPQSYYEALVMMKIMIFALRIAGLWHITLGRFDQYMLPFYKADLARGVSPDEILELTEEFFISINFDIDLYHSAQDGDDGQSLMLGGLNEDGSESYNGLSEICLKAAMELALIDPKINLRVNKNTPDSLYLLGTQMTKMGLGFPQYSNDDVVIPALIDYGYAPSDAYNYSVASCWEVIVPDGRDVPNIATFNFPKIVNDCLYKYGEASASYEEFFGHLKEEIQAECTRLQAYVLTNDPRMPIIIDSLFCKPCIEKRTDQSAFAAKYNNYGIHGAGIANATDALCAIKKMVFEEKKVTAKELIQALDANFKGYEALHHDLCACPKMGNNDDAADSLSCDLMDAFCTAMKNMKSASGGICRPGTGSANMYIGCAKQVGATADGRYAFTPYSTNFSPALTTHIAGPLSVIQSFTKFDLKRIANGGPLTLEIHDTTFRNPDGVEKVARLVQSFILLGGHQLQINAVNCEKLIDAQKHPGKYPNLIVRVWGWSGYFDELDTPFQDHVIRRTEYTV